MMLQARYWRPRLHRPESHRCWCAFCALGVSIGHILQKPDCHSGQGHTQDFSQASQVIFRDTARSAQDDRIAHGQEAGAWQGQGLLQGVTPGARWQGKLGMGLHNPWMLNGCNSSHSRLMAHNCHSQGTKVNRICCCCSQAC